MGNLKVVLWVAAIVAISGCTRSSDALRINTQTPPQPLPSSPTGEVETSQLDQVPPAGDQLGNTANPGEPQPIGGLQNTPQAPTIPQNSPSANDGTSLETTALSNEPISHEAMTGAWNVNSDNPDCRVFLSFTKWSGGYRAGTRRCNAPELTSVTAWDIRENRVVLVDGSGAQVASLGSVGAESYAGALSGGQPVTFNR